MKIQEVWQSSHKDNFYSSNFQTKHQRTKRQTTLFDFWNKIVLFYLLFISPHHTYIMTTSSKYHLFRVLMLVSFQSVRGQEEDGRQQDHTRQNHHDLYRLLLICLLSSCSLMFLYFCLNRYVEYRNRNRPPPGPFDNMRDFSEISASELTPIQRKLLLEVILARNNRIKQYKKVRSFVWLKYRYGYLKFF